MTDTTRKTSPVHVHLTIPGYGHVAVSPADLDRAISHYLPASPAELRAICQERSGLETGFGDVLDVSTFLLVLADWDRLDEGSST